MTPHDELLARLDADAKELHKTDAVDIVQDCVGNNLYDDMLAAAAAIRDLTAKLEAERRAREKDKALWADSWATYSREVGAREAAESRLAAVFERTKERCAKILDNGKWGEAAEAKICFQYAAAIRALEKQ